jgi:hypothetical protein
MLVAAARNRDMAILTCRRSTWAIWICRRAESAGRVGLRGDRNQCSGFDYKGLVERARLIGIRGMR